MLGGTFYSPFSNLFGRCADLLVLIFGAEGTPFASDWTHSGTTEK